MVTAAGIYGISGPSSFGGPFEEYRSEGLRHSEEAYRMTQEANRDLIDAWLDHQLFSWAWWLNVGLTTLPWLLWAWLRPRESTHRVLYIGVVLIVIASYLDFLGVTYGLWRYHIEIIPTIPSFLPWDFCMYPVAGMFFFMYEPRLSKYLKALLFACSGALIVEPIFILLQFYEPVNWSVLYSLPIHFVNYLIADWIGTRTEFKPLAPGTLPAWTPPGQKEKKRTPGRV